MSSVTVRNGTEGPRHDPYSYVEYTVTRPGFDTTIIHSGLDVWLQRGSERTNCTNVRIDMLNAMFEDACGFTFKQIERIVRKAEEARYRTHRSHGGVEWHSGYPGETFCMCLGCGECIESTFNEGAII